MEYRIPRTGLYSPAFLFSRLFPPDPPPLQPSLCSSFGFSEEGFLLVFIRLFSPFCKFFFFLELSRRSFLHVRSSLFFRTPPRRPFPPKTPFPLTKAGTLRWRTLLFTVARFFSFFPVVLTLLPALQFFAAKSLSFPRMVLPQAPPGWWICY